MSSLLQGHQPHWVLPPVTPLTHLLQEAEGDYDQADGPAGKLALPGNGSSSQGEMPTSEIPPQQVPGSDCSRRNEGSCAGLRLS